MKYLIIFLVALFAFAACKNNHEQCYNSPTPVFLRLVDAGGVDLLNPANPGSIDTSAIFMADANNALNIPVNVVANPTKDSFALVCTFYSNMKATNVYYLKLPGGDVDTINVAQTEMNPNCGNSYEITSFKFNGNSLQYKPLFNTINYVAAGYVAIK